MTEPYLFQTIHTLDGTPLRLDEHIAVLNTASRILFRRPFTGKGLDENIRNLLITKTPRTDRSIFVRLELAPAGDVRLSIAAISLYRGYALRSLCPDAVSLCYDIPFGDYPTSAREALAVLAAQQATLQGARCIVRCNNDGMVLTCDDAPLFAIKGTQVYTSPALPSVEHTVAVECIRATGLELIEEPLHREHLPLFDELFSFDHCGVMTLSRCNGHPYMGLMAERIAIHAARMIEKRHA